MPKTTVNADLYCDGALAAHGNWSGVQLSYLLTQALATPEVASVQFTASDGYKVAIPIDLAMEPQIIIAYEKDGQRLSEGLRLVIPGANGAAWIALITSISMSSSGADYPAAVTMGGGTISNIVSALNSTTETSSTPQQASVQTQPQPTPENSPTIQETPPANVTHPDQPAVQPQSSSGDSSWQTVIALSIAFALATALTVTAYVAYRRKRKHTSESN